MTEAKIMTAREMENLKEELRTDETSYWKMLDQKTDQIGDYLRDGENLVSKYYIGERLIDRQLNYARAKGNLCDCESEHLALLVGHSVEPLLQSVVVFKPKIVCWILSEDYGDSVNGEEMYEYLRGLIARLGIEESNIFAKYVNEDAANTKSNNKEVNTQVFDRLLQYYYEVVLKNHCEKLNRSDEHGVRHQFVIDITGGKKSMVAGAFLFGAYTLSPLSYVDFDSNAYDKGRGRPYGYGCNIGLVENTYETLQLGQWPRIAELYEKSSYKTCLALVEKIHDNALFTLSNEHLHPVEKFKLLLDYYERWDNNNYAGANELRKQNAFLRENKNSFPWAVAHLGTFWPEMTQDDAWKTVFEKLRTAETLHLYKKPVLMSGYVQDELKRISRLIEKKEDYRSAMMRAQGVVEFLLRSTIVDLVYSQSEYNTNLNPESDKMIVCHLAYSEKIFVDNKPTIIAKKIDALDQMPIEKNSQVFSKSMEEILLEALSGAEIKVSAFINLCDQGKCVLSCSLFERDLRPVKLNYGIGKVSINISFSNQARKKIFNDSWSTFLSAHRNWNDFNSKILNELRNRTVHTCLPVSRDIAKKSLDVAQEYYDQYKKWMKSIGTDVDLSNECFEPMPWEDACKLCELDLPMNIAKKRMMRSE